MVDVKKIDSLFKQCAGCCLFSSYAIAINYFSDGMKTIKDIFDAYTNGFTFGCVEEQQDFVQNKYHDYCRPKDMRGTEYIRKLIVEDSLSLPYCSVEFLSAEKRSRPLEFFEKPIDLLKTLDCLALIVYFVDAGDHIECHTVILGYDENQKFFVRDPNNLNIDLNVDLKTIFACGINEFLLLKRKN